MTNGIATETGSTLRSIFGQQPMAFALVLMNMALIGMFWFVLDRIDTRSRTNESRIHEDEKQVRELLARCIVPTPGMRLESGEDKR